MYNPSVPTSPAPFVPHTSEDDLGFSGSWRPMLSPSVTEGGTKLSMLSKQTKEHETTGIIMPSHDWSINPIDPAFAMGVAPHMSQQADPKKTVHFLPNPWATPWKCYTFQGPANEHFISPSNRSKMIGGDQVDRDLCADAFDDIYLFIKRSPNFDAQAKDYYLKKPDMTVDARVPLVERKYFANMLIRDKEHATDQHVVMCFTSAAYHYLIEQMRWATRFGGTPIDATWPAYLIGDPTNKAGALVWHQEKLTVGGLKMESNVMCLTKAPEQIVENPERRSISDVQLKGRVNLYDQASWNWPPYQEMVDFALEHWTEVPRDLIADACSHRAVVGARVKKAQVFDGGAGGVGSTGVGASDPTPPPASSVTYQDPTPPPAQTPPPQTAPPQTAPPAAAEEEALWVSGPATGGAVVKWPVSQVRSFAASGQLATEQVNIAGVWQSFAAAGFPAPAAPQPDAAPAGPAAPEAPAGPAAPAAPAEAAPPAAAPNSALQAEIDKLVPTYSSMTPEKQEQVRKVVGAISDHKTNSPGAPIPQHLSLELGQILMG